MKKPRKKKEACQPPYSQALTTLQTCLRFLLLCENVRFFRKIRLRRIKQIYGWAQPELAGQISRYGKTFHCDWWMLDADYHKNSSSIPRAILIIDKLSVDLYYCGYRSNHLTADQRQHTQGIIFRYLSLFNARIFYTISLLWISHRFVCNIKLFTAFVRWVMKICIQWKSDEVQLKIRKLNYYNLKKFISQIFANLHFWLFELNLLLLQKNIYSKIFIRRNSLFFIWILLNGK